MNLFWSLLAICLCLSHCRSGSSYNVDTSRNMRMYSLIAHCSQQQIIDWKCHLCSQTEKLKDVRYIENKTTSIMVYGGYLQSIDKIFFVFRGTINATNWIEDFTYIQVAYPRCSGCKVHQGFYFSYQSVAGAFLEALRQLTGLYPNKEIVITGASLGAALATIAAIQTNSIFRPVSQLHTYGSPRVGNIYFSTYVKVRIGSVWRVVHNRDIVPHVPLISQDFHHLPFQVLFDEEMNRFQVCSEGGEDPACSNAYFPDYSIEDHVTYWVKLDPQAICAQ